MTAHQREAVVLIIETQTDVPVFHQIAAEFLAVPCSPAQRQSGSQLHLSACHFMMGQLCGDCRIGQQTEILIAGLVRVERLVAFADTVPLALVFHDIAPTWVHGRKRNARGEKRCFRRLMFP